MVIFISRCMMIFLSQTKMKRMIVDENQQFKNATQLKQKRKKIKKRKGATKTVVGQLNYLVLLFFVG